MPSGTLRKSGDAYGDALELSNLGVTGILASKLRELVDQSSHSAKSLKELFNEFDEDQNGTISTREFKRLSKTWAPS